LTHRDAFSIPLVLGSLTPTLWLPTAINWSQVGAAIMWGAGVVLVCLQICYYVKMLRK
jgi:hypothetical protein